MQIVLYFISTIIFCIASAYVAFRSQFSKKQIVYFSFTSVLVMGIAVMLSNFYTTNILIENVKRVCLLSMLAPIAYIDSKELRIPNKMIILGLVYRAIVIPIELFTYSGIRDSYIVSDIIAAVPDNNIDYKTRSLDTYVIFVIDNTISMLAQDYDGKTERLTAAKEDCKYIVEQLNGAKFSVITFDNEVRSLVPFSDDAQFINNTIDPIYPMAELYAKGTSMNKWKDLTIEKIEEIKAEDEERDVALFFISDGEITTDEKLDDFSDLAECVDYGAVLGYGTEDGGTMKVYDWSFESYDTVMDPDNYSKKAISKIDEDNLESIAEDIEIDYVNMNDKKGLDKVLSVIQKSAKAKDSEDKTTGHRDIYFVFVIPLLLLFIYEYVEPKRRSIK